MLRAVAAALGERAMLLDVSLTLGQEFPEQAIFERAAEAFAAGQTVLLDDADVAARPRALRASRNAGDQFRGAGNFAFEDPSEPLRLLKALQDRADALGGCVVFTVVEEGHARYMQPPLVVRLEAADGKDAAALLRAACPGLTGDVEGLLARFPFRPSLAEVRLAVLRVLASATPQQPDQAVDAAAVARALRSGIAPDAAVRPEEVEHIDLAQLPGMSKIAKSLETHVLFPLLNADVAKAQALAPKRGVLLHGPPGTGKTTIGRALAHRLKGRFFMIRELLLQKELFEVFAQARACAPSVVFFDDIDVLLGGWSGLVEGTRGHDLTRFLLSQMDGLCTTVEAPVVVVMAAADAKSLPPAILRSGRIELWLKTEKPKTRERKAMLQHYVDAACRSSGQGVDELLRAPLQLEEVVVACEDFVPADLRRLVSDARNVAAAESAKRSGGEYLREAAEDLRAMKEEVDGIVGRMYT